MIKRPRCPKCKREDKLFFFKKDSAIKHPYYKCFYCGFVAVPTDIKCQRCKNEKYYLILAKDGILYCIVCWHRPLCSADRLQKAITDLRSVFSKIE